MAAANATAAAAIRNATAVGSQLAPLARSPLAAAAAASTAPPAGLTHLQLPTAGNAVLLLAIAANCALILAPLRPTLLAARSGLGHGDRQELLALLTPTYMLFGQSYFWACYGLFTGQPDISHFNLFGAGMCVAYLAFIVKGAAVERQVQSSVSAALGAAFVASGVVAFAPLPAASRAGLLALTATVFSMLQSAAPLRQALEALQTMTVRSFPLAVVLASCVSSLLWAQYAAMVQDYVYFIPNAINGLMGIVELAMVAWVASQTSIGKGGLDVSGDDRPLMPRAVGAKAWGTSGWRPWLDVRHENKEVVGYPMHTNASKSAKGLEGGWKSVPSSIKHPEPDAVVVGSRGCGLGEEPELEPEAEEAPREPELAVGHFKVRIV